MLAKNTKKPSASAEIVDAELLRRCPTLFDHLTQTTWGPPANEPRPTSTITLFRRPNGGLGASLSDKAEARTAFGAGDSLWAVLEHLEANASDPNYVWRDDRQTTGASKRQTNRR